MQAQASLMWEGGGPGRRATVAVAAAAVVADLAAMESKVV